MNTKQALIMSVVNMLVYWLIPLKDEQITCATANTYAWIKLRDKQDLNGSTVHILFNCIDDSVCVTIKTSFYDGVKWHEVRKFVTL